MPSRQMLSVTIFVLLLLVGTGNIRCGHRSSLTLERHAIPQHQTSSTSEAMGSDFAACSLCDIHCLVSSMDNLAPCFDLPFLNAAVWNHIRSLWFGFQISLAD